MTLAHFAERRSLNAQEGKPSDVNAMGASLLASAIAHELAVTHGDRALGLIGGQVAVLVVDEANPLHHKISAFGADAGAIAVRHAGTGQGQVAHGDVAAGHDEEGLALTDRVRDRSVLADTPSTVRLFCRQTAQSKYCPGAITTLLPHPAPPLPLRWLRELLAGSDLQGACACRKGEEKQGQANQPRR